MSPAKRKEILALLKPKYDALANEIAEMEDELQELTTKHEAMDDVIGALENDCDPDEDDLLAVSEDLPKVVTNPPDSHEKGIMETLLAYGQLSGTEVADLEAMLEDDNLDSRRYQEIYNAHLSTIHDHNDE